MENDLINQELQNRRDQERLTRSRGFFDAFKKEHGLGRENWAEARRRYRFKKDLSENAPRIMEMAQSHPVSIRILENLGKVDREAVKIRKKMGMGLEPRGKGRRLGQIAGALTSDLTSDNTRGFYWLLNALQATGAVLTEAAYGAANPNLFGTHRVYQRGTRMPLIRKEETMELARNYGLIDKNNDTRRGVRLHKERMKNPDTGEYELDEDGNPIEELVYHQINYAPTDVNSLLIPSGIAINTGLGLMTPFGGAEGYEAALPSQDDKTKTDNVIGEIAAKYFLGRTGNLLPYDEFVKVRPDVSKAEYNAYKAFKYDKNPDLDITDGDITLPTGIIKFDNDSIHGPELQFLGRGLPVTTGIIPFATAVAGTAAGVRRPKAIRGGLLGGLAGLAVGQVAGNLIEGERRRRNQAQNESYGEL